MLVFPEVLVQQPVVIAIVNAIGADKMHWQLLWTMCLIATITHTHSH